MYSYTIKYAYKTLRWAYIMKQFYKKKKFVKYFKQIFPLKIDWVTKYKIYNFAELYSETLL